MLDDDFFELDEDLLNATDFSKKFDETGMNHIPLKDTKQMCAPLLI